MVERGIIMAGGMGSRMEQLSGGRSKHVMDVGGQPMIQYSIDALRDMGVEKVTIVTNRESAMDIAVAVDTTDMQAEMKIQRIPNGMAGAVAAAAVKESAFVVLCGDCYHDPAPKLDGYPQLWWTRQDGMNQGAIWHPETNRIIEKPPKGLGRNAIIGARVYDQRAYELIEGLQPSDRGELELVDIDNWYLDNELTMTHYGGFFGDMGTPEGLQRVQEYIDGKA